MSKANRLKSRNAKSEGAKKSDSILGYGLPIYHLDRKIEEVSENFKDEANAIYVNSKKQEDTEL